MQGKFYATFSMLFGIKNHLPLNLNQYNATGLYQIAEPHNLTLGVGAVPPNQLNQGGLFIPFTDTLKRDFNVIAPYAYLGLIHPCAPRDLVDPSRSNYIAEVRRIALTRIKDAHGEDVPDGYHTHNYCATLLRDAIDTGIWNEYEENEWQWGSLDGVGVGLDQPGLDDAVLWAKNNGKHVVINPLIWQSANTADYFVLPFWLQIGSCENGLVGYDCWIDHTSDGETPDGQIDHDIRGLGALSTADRSKLEWFMKRHIEEVIQRYCTHPTLKGVVSAYMVVNEPMLVGGGVRQGEPYSPYPVIWAQINTLSNPDAPQQDRELHYLYKAFEYAEDATESCTGNTPQPKLLLNETFDLFEWSNNPANAEATSGTDANPNLRGRDTYRTIKRIEELNGTNRTTIDGVGIQAHLVYRPESSNANFNAPDSKLRQILESFRGAYSGATFALDEVHITELDIELQTNTGGQYSASTVANVFDEQATLYASFFHRCFYKSNNTYAPLCANITTWGLGDQASWKPRGYPLLFDSGTPIATTINTPIFKGGILMDGGSGSNLSAGFFNYIPKPAYFSVQAELNGAWQYLPPQPPSVVPLASAYPPPNQGTDPNGYP